MKINDAGLTIIKEFEGYRGKAYLCPANVWTIGYGTTKGVQPGQLCTVAEAEGWLRRDLATFEAAVVRAAKVELTSNQFSALVSLCYNIGSGALAKSTLIRKLNAGDFEGAQAAFASWNRGGGRVLPGLVRRRAAEAKLFGTP